MGSCGEERKGLGGSRGLWVITFAGLPVNVAPAAGARVASDTLTGVGLHVAQWLPDSNGGGKKLPWPEKTVDPPDDSAP